MNMVNRARVDADADLVAALRRDEAGAMERLVERYADRVYRLAMRITGSREDAQEVVQDALWTVGRKINTFKGESAFGSWLYRIAANAAYMKLRARRGKGREIALDDVLPALDSGGVHFDPMDDWSLRVDIVPCRASCGPCWIPPLRSCRRITGRRSSCMTSKGCRIPISPTPSGSACPR